MNMDILSLWAYVWDIVDADVDSIIPTLKNEIGLNTLSVATCYHSVDHLRVHRLESNFYSSQAAIYFQPDRSLYQNTRIEPPVSPLAENTNPLRSISDSCERHGMKLSSWTVCLHNSTIGRNQPEVAQRDVFGNPCWHALCPANEDVREYMRAVVMDLTTNYNFATVELESCDYQGGRHYHGHEKIGIPLGETDRLLLGLCFCESCRERAGAEGIDVTAVANGVRSELAASFESGNPKPKSSLTNFAIRFPKPVHISKCANLSSVRSLQTSNPFPEPPSHQWRWETDDIQGLTQKTSGILQIGSRFYATHRRKNPLKCLCETLQH